MLELAQQFKYASPERTVRFVAFVNEEPPYFQTELMGSRVYAQRCKVKNDKIVAMICLECLGYYNEKAGSQTYTPPLDKLYPDVADFIAFCSNVSSYQLLRQCIGQFRKTTKFPSQGLVAPEQLSVIGSSDHHSFWNAGYPAIMITDTAYLRNSSYHMHNDTADTLDYERMARVVNGIARVAKIIS